MFSKTANHTSHVVNKLPTCHFCLDEAAYEAKTVFGYRAKMCSKDFKKVGLEAEVLRLVIIDPAPVSKKARFSFGLGRLIATPNFV